MKKLVMPLMFVAIVFAIIEQSKTQPNMYIMILAIVVFVYGMIQLSAKTPSKHREEQETTDEDDK